MPGEPDDDLTMLRVQIDRVDDQILALLDRRAEVVREVGRRKR
jgi:chorismate mutase